MGRLHERGETLKPEELFTEACPLESPNRHILRHVLTELALSRAACVSFL